MGACKNKKLIGPYLDGQLGECHWLDEHISECSQCLQEYEAIQKLNHLAGKVDMAPPESNYWKNFSARTMARIATREAQAVKSRSWLFISGYKQTIRVFSLVATVVLIVGVSLIINNRYTGSREMIANSNLTEPITTSNLPKTEIPEQPIAESPATALAISFKQENGARPDININSAIPLALALQSTGQSQTLLGQFRSVSTKRTNLIEPDLPAGIGAIQDNPLEPNTDMVIVYQINQGSKAGEIPLMVYRQANVKFFGPDKAMPWRNINRLASPNWGFASGGKQTDVQVNTRLNMELDLSQDK